MNDCSHANTIDDHRTGDVLCIQCGLVLQERIAFESPTKFGVSEKSNQKLATDIAVNSYHLMLINFCFNAGLPLKLACTAYELYKRTRKEQDLVLISNSTRNHLFASMYVTLHNNGSSFTLRELSAHCNIDLPTLTRLTRTIFDKHMNIETYPMASNIIERLCANLQIERRKSIEIVQNVQDFEIEHSLGLNPATIAAAFVHLYVKKEKIDLKLKTICEMVGISTVSVKRFLNRFKLHGFIEDVIICNPNQEL